MIILICVRILTPGGGSNYPDTCLQWSSVTGTWDESLTLEEARYYHVSWSPDADTGYLMGGQASPNTSSLIKLDGSQAQGFPLKYNTEYVYNAHCTVGVHCPDGAEA